MKIKYLFGYISLFILLLTSVTAISDDAQKLNQSLITVENEMQELSDAGFPIKRYNDTLYEARLIYNSRLEAEIESNLSQDYSFVEERIKELQNIRLDAFRASDELKALEDLINSTNDIDLAPVLELYDQAKEEFSQERYERSLELIEATHKKISEQRAVNTKLKAFYSATSRTLGGFILRNWKIITISAGSILLFFLLTYKYFYSIYLRKKIFNLEQSKNAVGKLIAQTQMDYFKDNSIGEQNYHIRIAKYGEFLRELNRQISLIKEELAIRKEEKK